MSYKINIDVTANTTKHVQLANGVCIRMMDILNGISDKPIMFSFGQETSNTPSSWTQAVTVPPNSDYKISTFGDNEFSIWSSETRTITIIVTDDYLSRSAGDIAAGQTVYEKYPTPFENSYTLTNVGDNPIDVTLNSNKPSEINTITILQGASIKRSDLVSFFRIYSELGSKYQILFD